MIQYENILSQHEDLNAFITKNEIFYSTNFDDFITDEDKFLDWISPKYFQSFKTVVEEAFSINHIWKIARLQKMKRVCTPEYAAKCDQLINEVIDGVMFRVRELHAKRTPAGMSIEEAVEKSFGESWTNLINYKSKNDSDLSQEYAQLGLDIGKRFYKREDIINCKKVLLSLKNINASQELKYNIKMSSPGLNTAETSQSSGRVIIGVVIAIIAVVRLIMVIMR
ncbi:MAG: hypothetical protein COA58_00855 [Bacteroidetes bacterium]|nr:MAG: hypothetical protein COA58_00855 [Bacteroidota bacterium]